MRPDLSPKLDDDAEMMPSVCEKGRTWPAAPKGAMQAGCPNRPRDESAQLSFDSGLFADRAMKSGHSCERPGGV